METHIAEINKLHNVSSYRTYEEWKRSLEYQTKKTNEGSYRTYEEWKQVNNVSGYDILKVLTVPMRNGNCKW